MIEGNEHRKDGHPTVTSWLRREHLALLGILSLAAAKDAWLLARYHAALGVDGYYYVLQADTLRHQGHLFYATLTPCILYLLAAVSFIVGDAVVAMKIVSVTLQALLCLGLYTLTTRLTQSRWLGVCGATVAAFSGVHVYLIVEFINSLGALTLLVWSVWAGVRAYETLKPGWAALSVVLLTAALLSHRLICALVLLLSILTLLAGWLLNARESGRRAKYAVAATCIALFCFPAVLAAQPFFALPEWLSRELSIFPQWPLRRFDAAEGLMLLGASTALLMTVCGAAQRRQKSLAISAFVTFALWGLLVSLNPFLNHNTGFQGIVGRLSSLFHLQGAMLVPGVLWLLQPERRRRRLLIALSSALLLLVSLAAPLPYAATTEYMANRETLIRQLQAGQFRLCPEPLIIAPHGEQFVVASVLGWQAQQRLPAHDHSGCMYWLLHHVPRALLPDEQTMLYNDGEMSVSAFINDSQLRQLLSKTTRAERQQLFNYNPHLRTALYLGHESGWSG